jgi:hypothetical protein
VFCQLHVDLFRSTVLDSIVQSLLQNSKQANSYFEWEDAGHVIPEVDPYFLPLANLPAPTLHSYTDT